MTLSWVSIFRLGLVQMCLGAVVVLMTSTLNRLMVVELSMAATVPGFLVGLHYVVQLSRPKWGLVSDLENNRTKWIILGMMILGVGANLATYSVKIYETTPALSMIVSVFAYTLIGVGVGASGTSLLALLAKHTAARRRPAAAMITWLMMIFGIAMTAGVVGQLLAPYSPERLTQVVLGLTILTVVLSVLATWRVERGLTQIGTDAHPSAPLIQELGIVWAHPDTRRFTIFVFLSMTAYFMQELILEPYAGLVFLYTPSQTTSLSGIQNGGVFIGMLSVGILASALNFGTLRGWVKLGCIGSASMLLAIMAMGHITTGIPLEAAVFGLGVFNGMFAVSAIGSMMTLAGRGPSSREGTRMGLWGAAQAIAAGFGGLVGTLLVDMLQAKQFSTVSAYGIVFTFEAVLFIWSAILAESSILSNRKRQTARTVAGDLKNV